jgi:hypothetical protein
MDNGSFWLSIILLVATVVLKDLFVCSYMRAFHPSPVHILQEVSFRVINSDLIKNFRLKIALILSLLLLIGTHYFRWRLGPYADATRPNLMAGLRIRSL